MSRRCLGCTSDQEAAGRVDFACPKAAVAVGAAVERLDLSVSKEIASL